MTPMMPNPLTSRPPSPETVGLPHDAGRRATNWPLLAMACAIAGGSACFSGAVFAAEPPAEFPLHEAAPPTPAGNPDSPPDPIQATPSPSTDAAHAKTKAEPLTQPYQDTGVIYGWQSFAGRGSEWKYKQYHTPQVGPVLRLFETGFGVGRDAYRFTVAQPGWRDTGAALELRHGGDSLTRVAYGFSRAEFHPLLTIRSALEETNAAQMTHLVSPAGTRVGAYARTLDLSHDRRLRYPDLHAYEVGAFAAVPRGPWTLDLSVADRRVRDRSALSSSAASAGVIRLNSQATSAAIGYRMGKWASARVSLAGMRVNSADEANLLPRLRAKGTVMALDAVATPTSGFTLRGRLRRSRFSRSSIGQGYFQGDAGGQVDAKYLLTPRLAMRAGWRSRQVRFRNHAQETNRPRITSSWVGAAFRPARGWEAWGQWGETRVNGNPARVPTLLDGTAIERTDANGDPIGSLLPLAPDRLRRVEARVSAPLPRTGGLTLGWAREKRENRLRVVGYTLDRRDVTFWLPLTPAWSLTGTATSDRLGRAPDYLRPWLADTWTASGSLTGAVGRNLTLILLAARYKVSKPNASTTGWYALAARRRVTGNTDAELRVQRETFTDANSPGNTYRATTLYVEGRSRF